MDRLLLHANEIGLGLALVAVMVIFQTKSEFFLTEDNALNVGRAVSYTGIVAAVATLVLIAGELDLTVGATLAVGGIAAAKALNIGASPIIAILAGMAAGAVIGLFNAALIVGIGVNALIATIGMTFVWRGVAFIWTDGGPVSTFGVSWFDEIGAGQVLGAPTPMWLMFVVFVLGGFVLSTTKFGSHIYAIGGSRDAARLAGLPVWRVRSAVYILSGMIAGLAGVILASSNGSGSAPVGIGVELTIIAAVILGGTALFGGRGSMIGTFLGVLFLGALANGMNLVGLAAYWQQFVTGVALVFAVTVDEIWRRRITPQ